MKNVIEGKSQPAVAADAPLVTTATLGDQLLSVSLEDLVFMARTSFTEKRRKFCLAVTTAILMIDPTNPEALHLQRQIQSDVHLALQRSQAAVRNLRKENDPALRKNACRVLQNVLDIDPQNKEASELLAEIKPALYRERSTLPREILVAETTGSESD